MKISELKNLTIKELNHMLEEKRIDLSKIRIDINMARTNTSHALRALKDDIARIITELNIRRHNIKDGK